jgi:hypothetical protein
MTGNSLFAYDLSAEGDVLPGRSLGVLIPGAEKTDCRAMCVGPSGTAWCAITETTAEGQLLHLVRYRPGSKDTGPVDLGAVSIKNPDFTELTGADGKPLPFHAGFIKRKDGRFVNKYVILGVCEARDGNVYILAMHPYSVLKVPADALR